MKPIVGLRPPRHAKSHNTAGAFLLGLPISVMGVAVFDGESGAHLLNPLGTVHGGWARTPTELGSEMSTFTNHLSVLFNLIPTYKGATPCMV
jgi:hypothetical protein